MRVLAVANQKGGTGKSTLTKHLAHCFAESGHRTLAIDADPQCSMTRAFLGEPTPGLELVLATPYGEGTLIEDVIRPTDIPNLWLLPTTNEGLNRTYRNLVSAGIDGVHRLPDALDALSTPFDMVVIDTPAGTHVHEALFSAADAVLYSVINTSESVVSLQETTRIVRSVRRLKPSLKELGYVMSEATRSSRIPATEREALDALEALYGSAPVQGRVWRAEWVKKAEAAQATVLTMAGQNRSAADAADCYRQVTNTVKEAWL